MVYTSWYSTTTRNTHARWPSSWTPTSSLKRTRKIWRRRGVDRTCVIYFVCGIIIIYPSNYNTHVIILNSISCADISVGTRTGDRLSIYIYNIIWVGTRFVDTPTWDWLWCSTDTLFWRTVWRRRLYAIL